MFVDFNKVFKGTPQTQLSAPPALIEYINRSLPEGVKYIVDKNGTCVISSTRESCTIGGFIFRPTDEQKKVLGENYTQEDVLNYFYNIQEPVPMTLMKEGYVLLNGQEFPIEKMAYNPLAPIKYESGEFCLYPHEFPEAFPIKIGCDKYERTLFVSRIPNNSVSIAAFESSKEEPLYIRYFADDKKHSLAVSISLNIAKANNIRDIVEAASIYNAFIDGKGTLLGELLNTESNTQDSKKFDKRSILFWEKVLKIEEQLEVSFIPPQEDVDFDTICIVEQLYQNLVNKVPVRDKQIINSIEGSWSIDNIGENIDDSIGRSIFFEFEAMSHVELFGIKKDLPALLGIFNAVLQEHTINGKMQKIVLADENEKKKRYTSILRFKTDDELKLFKEKNHAKLIAFFRDAKRPHEYL